MVPQLSYHFTLLCLSALLLSSQSPITKPAGSFTTYFLRNLYPKILLDNVRSGNSEGGFAPAFCKGSFSSICSFNSLNCIRSVKSPSRLKNYQQ